MNLSHKVQIVYWSIYVDGRVKAGIIYLYTKFGIYFSVTGVVCSGHLNSYYFL